MNNLNKKQAEDLFEKIITERNSSKFPFKGTMEVTFRTHCKAVAHIAETIALSCLQMDSNKAYIMGLLHDAGRVADEPRSDTFHGVVGYHYLMKLGLPEIARISLTHCFCIKDFDISTYPQNRAQLLEAKEYLSKIEFDDYDLLIQLADLINDMGKTCTIEERFDSIRQRYNVPVEKIAPMVKRLNEIKTYFDNKCGCDIYDLPGMREVR